MSEKKMNLNDNNDIHRLVVCSDLRRNILLSLNEGTKSLRFIRDGLKISSTTAIHALKELEKADITFQEKNKKYSLTNIGKFVALKVLDFNNAAQVLKKHHRFWLDHDLGGIPPIQMEKIGWLKDSDLVEIDPLDLVKTFGSYLAFIKTAKWVKGVSPIYSADYEKIFNEVIQKNISIQLILTGAVFKKLTDTMGLDILNNLIHNYSLEIFISDENIKVAFTLSDTHLSFGLFSNNGIYDVTQDLICSGDFAVRWGYELFEYYKGRSKKYII